MIDKKAVVEKCLARIENYTGLLAGMSVKDAMRREIYLLSKKRTRAMRDNITRAVALGAEIKALEEYYATL